MTIDPKTMFKDGQLYTGKFSLEILSQDAFDFKNYQKHVDPMLKSLPVDAKYSDFTIIADGDVRIPCHKMFLAHHSTVLDKMFQTKCMETREKCVKMKASEKGVKAFMKYVYHFDLADAFGSSNVAVDLLDIARVYKVKPLEKAMKTLLLKRAEEWLDLDAALKLFLCTNGKVGLKSLKEKALKFVEPRRDELANSTVFQEFPTDDAEKFLKLLD
ncbi:Kelch repeat and BTB domain-containing protein 3 [Orchesella cincta]|uniref:Kelch repeat and BTB domain-containing protein 3 n=1 Tax=Orchesella cincta TaxID=48709 RepID=A0A1D2MV15_ORCCI|nr:Kelch repeat and BTB domain-containing protein 3 [Orchesella cincta]